MMGSGATTVISAQWEADDKSTEIFTRRFYQLYKQGNSSAEAMQKASLELINNKSNDMHEPYYWADFMINLIIVKCFIAVIFNCQAEI